MIPSVKLWEHPDAIKKGAKIDLSDLTQDLVVVWQKRYYYILMPLCGLIPMWVPYYFWNEKPLVAYHAMIFRYICGLHCTWLANSAATFHEKKWHKLRTTKLWYFYTAHQSNGPYHVVHYVYQRRIAQLSPRIPVGLQNWRTARYMSNWTTAMIDFCARLGLAYDLKTISPEAIRKRAIKTEDGSIYTE
ncbi:acyl-CoA Delta-9 desaturase-like [Xylocopa sonorina]|uniref:acyl-CoA Delta-9 desaturase-like n=1 Tax=Xylocopa sonorina TaxID=1818115 RepID=UPI00403B0FDB